MAVSAETKTEAARPVAAELITPTQEDANLFKTHAILGRDVKAADDELEPPVVHDPPAPSQAEANEIKVQSALGGMDVSAPVNVDVPAVMPVTAAVGDTVTCTMGNWDMQPSAYMYQWLADGEPAGSGDSYVVGAGDAGKSITCVVTASNAIGSTVAPPSNACAVTAAARAAPAAAAHAAADHPAERAGPPTKK